MKEKRLFEYAVIRFVPRVEREEFLNVGVIVYCHQPKFLQAKFTVDKQKLQAFFPDVDLPDFVKHLEAFGAICKGGTDTGPIGKLDTASRFRWLTAARSTILQCSKVHPGFCNCGEEAINKLFDQLVG